ncbi:hypothetical protein B0H11DRAFT_1918341 [Mycena galericulata]|nr:hypothetical protein B0H11DRAFT_1918341 [Mycena galericulata]
MAAPGANLDVIFSNDFQQAATSLANLVAANGGIAQPPWAANLQSSIDPLEHNQAWQLHIIGIQLYNQNVATEENSHWSLARNLNSTRKERRDALTRLPLPFARAPIPAIPAPPAPGAKPNPPPVFVAPAIVVPVHHQWFPATKNALENLSPARLATLLTAYRQPVPAAALRQEAFAIFIGVAL